MAIREVLLRITEEYPQAKNEEFAGHPLADFIRSEVPQVFSRRVGLKDFLWHASPGLGRWADAPWIAAFDPLVTETARDGFYPVYLFTLSLQHVYLSMNQGMSILRDEFGSRVAKDILETRGKIMHERVLDVLPDRFRTDEINLESRGPGTRLAHYEPGHAFGIRYSGMSLPSEQVLMNDVLEMLSLYGILTRRGGNEEPRTAAAVRELPAAENLGDDITSRRDLAFHLRIEQNRSLMAQVREVQGTACRICGFDFGEAYGEIGDGYLEIHHLTPMKELSDRADISRDPDKDFAVVCANCHRMLHRQRDRSFQMVKAAWEANRR